MSIAKEENQKNYFHNFKQLLIMWDCDISQLLNLRVHSNPENTTPRATCIILTRPLSWTKRNRLNWTRNLRLESICQMESTEVYTSYQLQRIRMSSQFNGFWKWDIGWWQTYSNKILKEHWHICKHTIFKGSFGAFDT